MLETHGLGKDLECRGWVAWIYSESWRTWALLPGDRLLHLHAPSPQQAPFCRRALSLEEFVYEKLQPGSYFIWLTHFLKTNTGKV